MLYWLAAWLQQYIDGFRVFHYLSVQAILATFTAFAIALLLGPSMIKRLVNRQIGQVVRELGPESHLSKSGTPTMGGVLILTSIIISTLLWANLANPYIWVVIFVTISFGLIGWIDDHRKIALKDSKGLAAKWKYLLQSVFALMTVSYLFVFHQQAFATNFVIPFVHHYNIALGFGFIVLSYFVIVGSSNAVNLTDGLDGLAIMPTVVVGGALGVLAYVAGNYKVAGYLLVPHVPGAGELVVYCSALIGAGLGFLWYNTYPAQVFMGDVGALGLGAALGAIAIIVRQEIAFFIMSGLFVMETLSVIIQVGSFKLTGKRVFKMAPIHHHFELKGWAEPKVIVRFWIITFILVLLGFATLKLR